VQFAHRRIFKREALSEEIRLLRAIASHYGYGAYVAALLGSNEYEERYGRGLPPGGDQILLSAEFKD
jgi:hypothetical protein